MKTPKFYNQLLVQLFFLSALQLGMSTDVVAQQIYAASEIRAVTATRKFSGNNQIAAVFKADPLRWMRASRAEFAVGLLGNSHTNRAFLSYGPVWRWGRSRGFFTEFGFSPTLLGGSQFEQADMGGVLHFTTSLVVGHKFKGKFSGSFALRIQHISNGSLQTKNPGMDLVGVTLRLSL